MSAGKEAPHTRRSRRKTGREPSLRAKVAPGLIVGGLLMATSWAMFDSNYLEPRQTLNEGVAGEFTLDSCDSSGSSGGGRTVCTGTFRSADGRSVVKDLALSEKNDASGLQRGDAFPARATLSQYGTRQVYRDDDEGRGNLTQNGVGSAGIGVVGLMTASLGALAAWRETTRARRVVKTALIVGAVAGAVMWIVGLTAGSGFLI